MPLSRVITDSPVNTTAITATMPMIAAQRAVERSLPATAAGRGPVSVGAPGAAAPGTGRATVARSRGNRSRQRSAAP